MNVIQLHQVPALIVAARQIDAPPSTALAAALAALESIMVRGETSQLTVEVDAEAQGRLRLLAALLAPATQAMCVGWLKAFAESGDRPRTPHDAEGVTRAGRGIWETCEALPAGVWTRDTRRAFQAVQRFWPTPAEVHGFLAPFASRWRGQAAGLRMLLKAGERHRERVARQAEIDAEPKISIDHVRALVTTLNEKPASTTDFIVVAVETCSAPRPLRPTRANDRVLLASCIESLKTASEPGQIRLLELRRDGLLRKLKGAGDHA